MKSRSAFLCFLLTGTVLSAAASAAPVLVADVPSYDWYHGCSPTAAGQLFGYWDTHGFPDLFDAAGDDVYLTGNVKDQISSPEHNSKYDPTPDDGGLPVPAGTSIADFMGTSVDPLTFGGTWLSEIAGGCDAYAASRGYEEFSAWDEYWSYGLSWSDLAREVNAGRPLLLAVDCSGDGITDHSVTGIGYDDRGADGLWYACFNTWHESETVDWYQWAPVSSTQAWGVLAATFVLPTAVPEPAALVSLCAGLALLGGYRIRGRK